MSLALCGVAAAAGRRIYIPFVPRENQQEDDCRRSILLLVFLVRESVCADRAAPFPRQPGQKV